MADGEPNAVEWVVGLVVSALVAAGAAIKKLFTPREDPCATSLVAINQKLEEMDTKLDAQNETLTGIEVTLGRYDERLLSLDRRTQRLEDK